MTHLDEGALRAWLDGEVNDVEKARIADHLDGCAECTGTLDTIRGRADAVAAPLQHLAPGPRETVSAGMAEAELARRNRRHATGRRPGRMNLFRPASWTWPAWAGLAAAGVLVAMVSFPPLRAAALEFIELFRIERVKVAAIDPGDLPARMENSTELARVLSDQVQVTATGESREVASTSEAAEAAGFDVRLPVGLGAPSKITVEAGASVNVRVDLERVREVLRELGRSDIELPDGLDGAEVGMVIPSSVRAEYPGTEPGDTTRAAFLVELPIPAVSAPAGFPVDRIGEAFLQVLGMSAEEAASFSRSVDWSTTLVVPVPRDDNQYEDVAVDGTTGTLIRHTEDDREEYLLVWVRDDIIYALSGRGAPPSVDMSAAPRVAERPAITGLTLAPSPNPSRGEVTLRYTLPPGDSETTAALDIYDVSGRRVIHYGLPGGTREGSVRWNGSDERGTPTSPGMYYARLTAGKQVVTSRISRMR